MSVVKLFAMLRNIPQNLFDHPCHMHCMNYSSLKVTCDFRNALKRAHLQGASFGLAEAFQFCASAAAFRYGGHLVVNGEMSMDEVIK